MTDDEKFKFTDNIVLDNILSMVPDVPLYKI